METFWFFLLRFRRAYDSAYDSDFWFSLGHKLSYDSDYDSDSVVSENHWAFGVETSLLKLINYSYSSYPTRASYSGQVDGFRNPMKN